MVGVYVVGCALVHPPSQHQQQRSEDVGDDVEALDQLDADDDRHAAHRQRQDDAPEEQNPALRCGHGEVTEDQQEDDEVVERKCALDQINGDVVDAVGAAGEQDHGDRRQQSEDQPADAPNDCLFARRLAAARKDEQVNEQEYADDYDDSTDRQWVGTEGRERGVDQHR